MIGIPQFIKPQRYRSWAPSSVAPTIDWRNPLTRGLRSLIWPLGAGVFGDLVTARPRSTGGTAATDARGAAVTGDWTIPSANTTDLNWTSGGFSCAVLAKYPAPNVTDFPSIINRAVYVDGANNQGWLLYCDSMGGPYHFYTYKNNALYDMVSNAVVAAGEHFIGGMSDGLTIKSI